jgi:uncharacterized membrane protein YhiD involved in acid resistance
MIDYFSLQNSTENPTFTAILFTVLLAFFLASLLAITYQKTNRLVYVPCEFMQSMILLSIVAATVIQAIGDSVARGLGILGAMAIIHFRTNMKTPRNMAFTFAALAAGIACGVYAFVIGITGTIGFCLAAFVLRHSPMSRANNLVGCLYFELPKSSAALPSVVEILQSYCTSFTQIRYQINGNKVEKPDQNTERVIAYEYHLKLREEGRLAALDADLAGVEVIQALKITFEDTPETV